MKQPDLRTIPAGQPFAATLAAWILKEYGDSLALPRLLLLLPSRRACRAMREAFLEAAGGKPLLLPRIQPIGELDEESIGYGIVPEDISPPIDPLRRELLLTKLVMQYEGERFGVAQAAELARQLAQFIDEAARENLDFAALEALAPEDLAEHWQETLEFLKLISHHWPKILEGEGVLDPAKHRSMLLAATAAAWRKNPPQYPVIAAGSTGSIPATAALLSVIARLPQGMVVLPGLDTGMTDAEWDQLGPTHPQFGMRVLVGCFAADVGCQMPDVRKSISNLCSLTSDIRRASALRAILQPPEATAKWSSAVLPPEGLEGIHILEADTLQDEARMIGVALRETLETPGKTAALVTPDRQLARMVASQMQRFGITIDDSAGRPLKDTPPAVFLRLVAELAASRAAPVPLLSLLRHPLAGAGRAAAECRRLSREMELEKDLLRGIRRSPGVEALRDAAKNKSAAKLLATLAENSKPLMQCFSKKTVPLRLLLEAHMQLAEWLASTDEEEGVARLWADDDGNQLAAFLAELLPQAELLPPIDPQTYPGLFDIFLSSQLYRPRWGLHPRLHILSPIEARLLHFDRVILGGLNEGAWPALPPADPWMSRPMRNEFGLPPPERGVGQSAHDFYMLASAPEAFLSRARKVEGTPATPSRWLVRLETLAGEQADMLHIEQKYARAIKLIDAPIPMQELSPPKPVPPLAARPRKMSVTAVDTWLSDPYRVYAKYILRLKMLEPLDEDPDAADFGNLVHGALERFVRQWPEALPENPLAALLKCGREVFAGFPDRPAVSCLWWPRFEAMAAWLIEVEKERRKHIRHVSGELNVEWQFDNFTLTARIDRLELNRDGSAAIIDYKTGDPSSDSVQLPLEALVARNSRLLTAADIILEYWKLSGNPDKAKIKPVPADKIAAAEIQLKEQIAAFDKAETSYTASAEKPRFSDYEHLTRRQEWESV